MWSTHATGSKSVDFVDQSVRLVGQLADDIIPLCETLVATLTVGENSREAAGTGVAARPGHALHAHAATVGFVALLLRDAAGVAVAGWGDKSQSVCCSRSVSSCSKADG